MKKLLACANEYLARSDWKDLAMLKLGVCAAGVLVGLVAPRRVKKTMAKGALLVLAATYVPQAARFLDIAAHKNVSQ